MSLLSLLTDVLFVGHSLVGPNLPALVEGALIRQGDASAVVQAQVINGASLRYNWDNPDEAEDVNAHGVLANGVDVLILTEAVPLAEQLRWNDTVGQIAAFGGLAREANPETRIYLYETWHSLKSGADTVIDGDAGAGVPWRERIDADAAVWRDLATAASARLDGAPVQIIPAGQAMGRLSDAIEAGAVPGHDSIAQFFVDDLHPNGKGLYFLALVHAAMIDGKDPKGLPPLLTRTWQNRDAVISDGLARALQRVARDAVQAAPVIVATPAPDTADLIAEDTLASVPDAAQPTPLTKVTNPALSFGLAGVNDWSVQQPFLDVMKTARVWTGHLADQWGGFEYDRLVAEGFIDAQGWPRGIPPGVTGLSTLILTQLPADAVGVAGDYVLTYQGTGTLVVEGRATDVQASPGRITFAYTPGEGSVVLTLTATDAADPVRGIRVVRADRADLLATGAIFNPDWLARLRGVQGVRFMDWMATNNSTLSSADDRPEPDDATYTRNGVPVEVMVALANELQADPWFTIPHLADDALVRLYARTVRDTLAPDLQASVEFSNEVWNWQFAQATWAEEQGQARWGQPDTWVQFYALRASEVADIWADVFAEQAPTRLRRVIATQTGWYGLEDQILNAPLVIAEGAAAPATHFDAYAVTGYFSALLGSDAKRDALQDWIAQSRAADPEQPYALAVTLAAAELRDGATTGDATDSLKQVLTEMLPYHAKVARDHRLDLVMYEGGTHVVGYGAQVDDADLTAFFNHLNYSPEMAALYDALMAGWAKISDAPFNAFVDVSAPDKWGSWGALRHLGDENPRWQALAAGCGAC
jgi:hypothetical protein